jgi:predicted ATP-grasp superfamily ATP-dependent carboligase
VLVVEELPELHRPVLFVALAGWVDAGLAGASAAEYLEDHLDEPRPFGRVDLSEILDLQHTRPTVRLDDARVRVVEWPEITLVSGRLPSAAPGQTQDVVVCRGPEPGLHWRAWGAELVGLAKDLGVRLGVMLAGMPVMTTHRRPLRVLATATSRSLAQEIEPLRPDYEGPTGAQTVLQYLLGEGGIPSLGLWAQVPHYLAGGPSPAAMQSVVRRAGEVASLAIDVDELDETVSEYHTRVEQTLRERPDLSELVDQLDAAPIEIEDDSLPTGDEIASEIERFLRGRPDRPE